MRLGQVLGQEWHLAQGRFLTGSEVPGHSWHVWIQPSHASRQYLGPVLKRVQNTQTRNRAEAQRARAALHNRRTMRSLGARHGSVGSETEQLPDPPDSPSSQSPLEHVCTPPPCAGTAAVPKSPGKTAVQRPPPRSDKPVRARDTHNRKARCVTAAPGMAMSAMAQHHLQTNRIALRCVVRCCDEQTAPAQTRMGPSVPLRVRHERPIRRSGPRNNSGPKSPEHCGSTPTPSLGQARACAKGGGGGAYEPPKRSQWTHPSRQPPTVEPQGK